MRLARFQVPHYWLVDPKRRVIRSFALTADGYELIATVGEGDRYSPAQWPGLEIDGPALWTR
jgi:Uma2 family endonuclease